jgi:hypothetical protein
MPPWRGYSAATKNLQCTEKRLDAAPNTKALFQGPGAVLPLLNNHCQAKKSFFSKIVSFKASAGYRYWFDIGQVQVLSAFRAMLWMCKPALRSDSEPHLTLNFVKCSWYLFEAVENRCTIIDIF